MMLLRRLVVIVWTASLLVQTSLPVGAVRLQAADGVGTSYRDQLWRMSGRLIARGGGVLTFTASFFRYAEPHGVVLYAASVCVVDESTGRLFSERRVERADLGLADANVGTLDVRVGTWRLRESSTSGAARTFDLDAKLNGAALVVHGTARKPRFALRSTATERDEYSSIASFGRVTFDDRHIEAGGVSWLDRESSNESSGTTVPIAQFRVQLDDGREIYVETSGSAGTQATRRRAYLIQRDGTIETLDPSSYEFGEHPGSTWLSPHTHVMYPDIWALHVDGRTEFLSLEPVAYDRESLAHGDGLSYWDGAVDVYDVTPGSQGLRLGSGYVLMYGYPTERKAS